MVEGTDTLITETDTPAAPPAAGSTTGRWSRADRLALAGVIVLMMVQAAIITSASRHNSATFDEITLVTAGARGFETGKWDLVPDGPPVMHYLYGLPAWLSGLEYPDDAGYDMSLQRYQYAQEFVWTSGNDGDRIMALARGVAAACAALVILLVFLFTRSYFDPATAFLAAVLVAFLPDIVAHGGVAYNDIGLAPAFLAAVWALDRAARRPSYATGALAGTLVSVAIGIKHTALILGPIGLVFVLLELATSGERGALLRRLFHAVGTAVVVGYAVQVAIYRGDITLDLLWTSTIMAHGSITGEREMPTYLLGVITPRAGWSFYPVVLFFKTSAALHLLMILGLLGALMSARKTTFTDLARSPLRALLVAVLLYGTALVRSDLTLGFRYALALLPLLAILIAIGGVALWRRTGMLVRATIVVLTIWSAGWTLSFYPWFLAYTSEYQPDRDRGYEVFVDSSLDWGQGLIALRDFMQEEGIDRIYLSYFGSALPEGYGIDYVPLRSFFPLPPRPRPAEGERPSFVAISATNLTGLYFPDDPYAGFRDLEPYRILAHTIFVYPVHDE